jgi:signal transduction histidine kinase
VFKHAQATRVKIRLRQLPQGVCMEIADNGRAFSQAEAMNGNDRQPLGLLGMQERVRLVNGQFAIESVPKRGTTVRVQIPLPNSNPLDAAERGDPVILAL